MKQICKRLSVIFLALTIVSGSVLTTGLVVNADTYKKIFSEDFEDYEYKTSGAANKNAMIANGWDVDTNGKANYNTGSSFQVPYGKAISVGTSNSANTKELKNYSVSAKMTFVSTSSSSGSTYAGLTGRLTSTEHNTGYDIIVMKTNPTDAGATLRLRYDAEKLIEATVPTLNNDTPFNLKLEFRGTKIYGYVDNVVVISYDTANDSAKSAKGWAGIRKVSTKGMDVVFDDFVVSEIVESSYPDGYLYYNNFDQNTSLEEAGLVGVKTNTIQNGVFNLGASSYNYLSGVVDSLYWEDYTVEADVKIVKKESDTGTKAYACIVARSTDGKNEGYEYRMVYNNGKTNLELAKRNGETVDLGKYEIAFELNKSYKMTMTVHENNIMCWFGDILVFDVEDKDAETYATGYAGLRATGNTSYLSSQIDNFSVREYQAPTITYPAGYLYCNDFESNLRLKNEGWSKDGTKKDGVYVLDGSSNNYLTNVNGSKDWTDYVVEAEVMHNDDGTLPQYAGIVARATGARTDGYELLLIKETGGKTVARMYKRGIESGKINDLVNKTEVTLEPGKMNSLKLVVKGADILGYLNGELLFEITDEDPYLKGYAGVISATGTAKSTYDNYAVREIQPTDLPTDATYPEGYLYYNDFSSVRDLGKEGWHSSGTKKDGVYQLAGSSNNYLTKVKDSDKWADYVVEADVVLHDNGTSPQYTAIAARAEGIRSKAYEMILIAEEDSTTIRLYKRGIDSGKINDVVNKINVSVIPNEVHKMKMVVQGATIICYFDGVKVLEVTDKSNPYMTGYAGVISATGSAKSSFDYFAVREIADTDIVKDPVITKQDGDIWFYDDFSGEESMTERGWNTDKVAVYDNSALVKSRAVIDGVQDSDKWTDYEVSATIFVDKEAGIYNDNTTGAAAICARAVDSSTGYEFGLLTSPTAATYLRLLNRKTGINIAEDKSTPVTAGAHNLRMVCIGDEIYCYMDDKLVMAVKDDTSSQGYAGMRASGYNAYYQDFTVRKARPVSTIIPAGPVSPATGDLYVHTTVLYFAAAVMSLSVLGLLATTLYSKKRK